MVESELIADVRAGNRGAFAALVETYQAGVYNLSRAFSITVLERQRGESALLRG